MSIDNPLKFMSAYKIGRENKNYAKNLAADITQAESDEMLTMFIKATNHSNMLRVRMAFHCDLVDYCEASFKFAFSDIKDGKPIEKGRHHPQLREGISLATSFIIGYLQGRDKVLRDNYDKGEQP